MRGEIHVLEEAEFEKWREDKEAGPPLPKRAPK
jgi:heme/copper-type cytochrome/quinol oxidase subunit 2